MTVSHAYVLGSRGLREMSIPDTTPVVHLREGTSCATITSIRRGPGRTTLCTDGGGAMSSVVVACRPDVEGARRRLGSVRRIDRVELTITPLGTRARVRGKRHRLPFIAAVPLAVALGLTELGIRATLRTGAA